jgi:hypothetical protein
MHDDSQDTGVITLLSYVQHLEHGYVGKNDFEVYVKTKYKNQNDKGATEVASAIAYVLSPFFGKRASTTNTNLAIRADFLSAMRLAAGDIRSTVAEAYNNDIVLYQSIVSPEPVQEDISIQGTVSDDPFATLFAPAKTAKTSVSNVAASDEAGFAELIADLGGYSTGFGFTPSSGFATRQIPTGKGSKLVSSLSIAIKVLEDYAPSHVPVLQEILGKINDDNKDHLADKHTALISSLEMLSECDEEDVLFVANSRFVANVNKLATDLGITPPVQNIMV